MSGTGQVVSIGPVVLAGLEVPEMFERAATMQPVVHRLIGGGRVVQLMGENPCVRELAGILTGPGAVGRAITFEALRDSGAVVPLVIGAWSEAVVVTALELTYTSSGSVIRYWLQAEALPIPPETIVSTVGTVIGGAIADLGSAIGLIGGSGDVSLSGSATTLAADQSALNATALSSSGTPSLDTAAPSAALSSAITSSGGALTAASSAPNANAIVPDAPTLSAACANAQTLACATQAGGYVNRATGSIAALGGASPLPAIHS